jgi:hypothetical protein
MAKKQLTDTGASSGPRPMSDGQRDHFKSLVSHTLDNALANGHGHFVGSQGPKGHTMVPSDHAKQAGGYIPQAMGRDGGAPFDDNQKAASDYGTVDKTGD